MITRNSCNNICRCINCNSSYTIDDKLPIEERLYCPSCNFYETKSALDMMNNSNPNIDDERKAGKRQRQKKVKQYKPDFIPQVT